MGIEDATSPERHVHLGGNLSTNTTGWKKWRAHYLYQGTHTSTVRCVDTSADDSYNEWSKIRHKISDNKKWILNPSSNSKTCSVFFMNCQLLSPFGDPKGYGDD